MSALTETAIFSRKFIKYTAIGLVLLVVLRFSWQITKELYRILRPPPPPPPTVGFGNLPLLNFPKSEEVLPQLSYKLETVGGLPELPAVGKVYFMPLSKAGLLAPERADALAKKLGFSLEHTAITPGFFSWQSGSFPVRTLQMDISTLNFKLEYDYKNDQSILKEKNLPSKDEAKREALSFLENAGVLPGDLSNGKVDFESLKFVAPNLLPALSVSEADFVRLILFRKDLDENPILPPNPKKGLVSFLISGVKGKEKRFIEVNFTYHPVDRQLFETYPLRTVLEAWEELKGEGGYVANLGENTDGKITITKIYLGFFEAETPQDFLQPIFVFEGRNDFFGYIQAVAKEWLR